MTIHLMTDYITTGTYSVHLSELTCVLRSMDIRIRENKTFLVCHCHCHCYSNYYSDHIVIIPTSTSTATTNSNTNSNSNITSTTYTANITRTSRAITSTTISLLLKLYITKSAIVLKTPNYKICVVDWVSKMIEL